jgi:hypothetical protein
LTATSRRRHACQIGAIMKGDFTRSTFRSTNHLQ